VFSYGRNIKLTGIIYLHRISDNRMSGSALKNLRMFANLCGDDAIRNVILVTTMWTPANEVKGNLREADIRANYWKAMLDHGSRTMRFENTFESAWTIITEIMSRDTARALLVQREIVDFRRRINETQAGIALNDILRRLLEQSLRAGKLEEEPEDLICYQIEELKIPFSRRIRLRLSLSASRALIAMALPFNQANGQEEKRNQAMSLLEATIIVLQQARNVAKGIAIPCLPELIDVALTIVLAVQVCPSFRGRAL